MFLGIMIIDLWLMNYGLYSIDIVSIWGRCMVDLGARRKYIFDIVFS